MEPERETIEKRPAELGLWDAVSVIVGIVVGVSIFKAPPTVFANVGSPWAGVAVWGLGGLVALAGALCYAELASAYPGSGGDYLYLTRAFGPLVGFLFAWTRLAVILTGNIAALAYVFADYAVGLFAVDARLAVWFACAAVGGLTLFNVMGLKTGKTLQNLLSAAKVLGLAGLLVAGLVKGGGAAWSAREPVSGPGFGLAMILVLYAYGGWNDAVFVAADVREPKRNMPRALALGTLLIAGLYILVNAAFVSSLGFAGLRGSRTPAADVLGLWLGNRGVTGMSLMVMVSALGAVSGLILAGCRLHASVGADYRIFAWLGRWNCAAQRAGVFARDAGSRVRPFDRHGGDRRRAEHGRPDGDNSWPAGTAVERIRLRHARGRHFALVLVLLSADGHFAVGAALQRP